VTVKDAMRTKTIPRGRGRLIRNELAKGPCTAAEMGAILRLPMRICSAWLGLLRCKGQAQVVGQRPVGRRFSNIYALLPAEEIRRRVRRG